MAPGLLYPYWRRGLRSSSTTGTSGRDLPVAVALNRRQADSKKGDEEEKPVASPPSRDNDIPSPDVKPEAPARPAVPTRDAKPAPPAVPTRDTEPIPEPQEPARPSPQEPARPAPQEPVRPSPQEPVRPSPPIEDSVKPGTPPKATPIEVEPSPAPEPITREPVTTPPTPTTTRRGGILDGITGGLGDVVDGVTSAILPPAPPIQTTRDEITAPPASVTTQAPASPPAPETSEILAPSPSPSRRPGLGDILDGIIPGPPVIAPVTSVLGEILPTPPARPPPAPVTSEDLSPSPSPSRRPGLGDVLDGIIPGPPVIAPVTSVLGEILPTPPARPPPAPPVESTPAPPTQGGGIISRILDDVLPSAIPVPNVPDLPEIITSIIRPPPQTTPSAPSASSAPPVGPPVRPPPPVVALPSVVPVPDVPDLPEIISSVVVRPPTPTTVAPVQQPSRLPPVPSVALPGEDADTPVVAVPSASVIVSNTPVTRIAAATPSASRVSSGSAVPSVTTRAGVVLAAQAESLETGPAAPVSASIEVTTTIPVTSVSVGTTTFTLANGQETTSLVTSTSVSQRTTVTTIPNPSSTEVETVKATGGTSNPAIMGGAIGGALVIILGLLIGLFMLRRRRRKANIRLNGSFSPENGFGGEVEPKSYLTVPPTRHSPRERKNTFAPDDYARPAFERDLSETQVRGATEYSYDFTLPSRNDAENPFMDQRAELPVKPPMVTVTPPGGDSYVTLASAPRSRTSENTRTLLAPANDGTGDDKTSLQSGNPFADPVILPPTQASAPLNGPAIPKEQRAAVKEKTAEKDPFEDPTVPTKYIKVGKDDKKLGRYSASTIATTKRDTLPANNSADDLKRASIASTAFDEAGNVMVDAM